MALGALLAIGMGIQAAGSIYSAASQYRTNKANEAIGEFNARQSRRAAGKEAERLTQEEAQVVGRARAIMGASGIASDVGSNEAVLDDIRRVYAEDIAAIRVAGEIGAFQQETAADLAEMRARESVVTGALNVGSTALTYALLQPQGVGSSNLRFTGFTGISGANRVAGQGGTPLLGGF